MILKILTLVTLVVTALLDLIITIMVKYKHPYFNEANPLFIWGMPLWVIAVIKFAAIIYICYYHYKKYRPNVNISVRYFTIYFLVFVIVVQTGWVLNNWTVYNLPEERIVPIPDDIKIEAYKETYTDLTVVKQIPSNISTKYPRGASDIPITLVFFFINVLQFIIWRSFEKDMEKEYNVNGF